MHANYDVVVIGAGPAGGQCARELAIKGKKVLLVEKAKDFSVNNYSSGGAPDGLMSDYALPQNIIGSSWNKIALHTSTKRYEWCDSSYAGVILDFMKLREYLALQVIENHSVVLLNHAYHSHEIKEGKTLVYLRDLQKNEVKTFITKVLVDGTGAERKVLQQGKFEKRDALAVTGIEYLVEVPYEQYTQYSEKLSFFLGLKWMPQGYSWIFPMEKNRLKIGVIRYFSTRCGFLMNLLTVTA